MSNKYKIAVLFGAGHGFNDFIAGYLLAHLSVQSANWQLNTIAFLVYSVVAFGGQLPAGMMLDKIKRLKVFSLLSVSLMVFAIALSYLNIYAAILASAFASALIHVCGGAACSISDNKSATLAGIFTSPGVIGLITGGILGATTFSYFYFLILPLLLLLFLLAIAAIPSYAIIDERKEESLLDTHDFFMLMLLVAIAFRSLFWNVLHMMCFDNTQWLLGLGISAAAGKLMGGYIADKVDWKKFVFVSILCSALLLNAGKYYFPVFCVGVALLQSAVPVTLLLMQNYMRNRPATASGLSLGAAIIIAGLPTYFEQFRLVQNNKIFLILLSIAFFASNFWIIRNSKTA
jgi:FSR family fosmidomycin resistance protein-like MFS transporter